MSVADAQPNFRMLFEAVPGLFLVLLPDTPRFTIVAVSNAYAQATMVPREAMIGRALFDVFPDDPDDPAADGVRNLSASLERALSQRAPDAMALQKYNVRKPAAEGGEFEERWWSPLNTPLLDEQGQVRYLIHRVEDATEYVRLKMMETEQGRVTAALRERTAQMELDIFQRARQLQEANEQLRQANAESARLYEKTRELDQLKTQFFATVSHELRTPLTLILGPVRALLADHELPAASRKQLDVIERNARTLLLHVNDLLEVARLDARRMTLCHVHTDAARLARFVASHFESLAQGRSIGFLVEAPAALAIEADPDKLQRVLINVLSNAFKFTPDRGCVRLTLRQHDEWVQIEVADSGPGIPPAQRGHVFEAFRQLDGDAQRRAGGTGLGLAIARDLISLHGGDIRIGEAPEGGALFTLRLPIKAPAGTLVRDDSQPQASAIQAEEVQAVVDTLQPAPPAREQPLPGGPGPSILVVEDNADMRDFIVNCLSGQGYAVRTACNGFDGLQQALDLAPDLIVTDIMMPEMSGDQMIAAIRQHAHLADVPIVVLSAKADDEQRLRMLREGAQDFLIKPFASEELLARIDNQVSAWTTMRALRQSEEQLRELFEQAFDGIFIASPDGHYIQINDAGCALMGEPREALLGRTSFDLVAPPQHERMLAIRKSLMGGPAEVHVAEWQLHRKDGIALPVEVKTRMLPDGRWVSFVRDISAHRRELEVRQSLAKQLESVVNERTRQLRQLGADLEAVEERERRQIARDLHDDLGQTLAAARIRLAALCSHPQTEISGLARAVDTLIEQANAATRSLASQLAPAMLYELGLSPALEWLGQDIQKTFGLKVTVVDDGQAKPLGHTARAILYRAARELLINAAKHARADSATVRIWREGRQVCVTVSDAGVGFDPSMVSASHQRGMGLMSMRERLSFIGGQADIRSIPGDGTEARIMALLDDESAD